MKTSTTEQAVEELSFREAILPPKLQELRQKLGRKAKQEKRFRFYSLYGRVFLPEVLQGGMECGAAQWRGSGRGWSVHRPDHRDT